MNLSRYIAASTLSHLLLFCLLWITLSNIKTVPPVFNVNIVEPLETEKPPEPKLLQPNIAPVKPLITKQNRNPLDEKILPETLYGEGSRAEEIKPDQHISRGQRQGGLPNEKGVLPPEKDKLLLAPPSALFDKKTIENYAKKDTEVDKGLTFEIPGFQHRGYMKMLKEKIESIWRYPKEAARLGLSGDLYVKFSIKKDGKLGEIDLLRTSGYKDLDEAAMKALKDAEPFWPLPADWEKDDLEINGHFIYVYGSAFIM